MTTVMAVLFGGAALLNELALRESPAPPSRYRAHGCVAAQPAAATRRLSIGPGATLEVTAEAFIDDEPVGSARLAGSAVRDGRDVDRQRRWPVGPGGHRLQPGG